jgi:hypothetical protein
MKMPRWIHCVYAFLVRYFWLPCPMCGRKFGGHESGATLYDSPHEGHVVCRDCSGEAERINAERHKAWSQQGAYNRTVYL